MKTVRSILSAIIIAVGIIIAGSLIQTGFVTSKSLDRFVTVKGLAEQNAKADRVIWRLMFNYASDTLPDVYQGTESAQKKILAFLEAHHVPATDIQTQPIAITDNQAQSYSSSSNLKRYSASSSLVVMSDQVDLLNTILQQTNELVQSGIVLSGSEVHYLFTQLNNIKPAMLTAATANAKEAANTFAKNANSQLGGIRQASQGLFTVQNADDSYGDNSPDKKVRVVTTVQYYLK
ncbi:MAG: hypothetical protein A2103_03305 [Gammaproteobacteria bacterium GWF2_41_13]|nr:MAG: hypothetical protein A2103_03305 [Gammaproteobacteria bacterium GWF2_41_13]